jgi:HPt (histidine-containing phosphotransfer) domain-containing protein
MNEQHTPPESPEGGERPAISPAWLADMRARKPDFLRRLFDVFREDEPKRMAALEAAVGVADLEQTRYLAHSLKGAAATLGMEPLRDACRGLEFAAKDEDTAGLPAALALVRREMERVYAEMAEVR